MVEKILTTEFSIEFVGDWALALGSRMSPRDSARSEIRHPKRDRNSILIVSSVFDVLLPGNEGLKFVFLCFGGGRYELIGDSEADQGATIESVSYFAHVTVSPHFHRPCSCLNVRRFI